MQPVELNRQPSVATSHRAEALFQTNLQSIYIRTDAMFAWLLAIEWLVGVATAIWISPRSWSGLSYQTHFHVWAAVLVGGAIVAFPIYLALARPGWVVTRHVIAIGQMLFGALLIHLTGGRIETHFHIFGSLAFLATYRDWRVLITASAVVVVDHFFRGHFWPQSIFGVQVVSQWRWLEHAGWVVFEDFFLIRSSLQGLRELRAISLRQAEIEATRDRIAFAVVERTSELTLQTTVLRQTTDELRESEERFRGAFDASAIGIARVALNGQWLALNRALSEIVGYTESELLATNVQSITHPEDLAIDLEQMRQLLAGKLPYFQREKRFLHKNGRMVQVQISVSLVKDASGQPLYSIDIIQDITARKNIERERDRFFGHSLTPMCVCEYSGYVRDFNPAMEATFGVSREELQSQPFLSYVHPDDRERCEIVLKQIIAGSSVREFEFRCRYKNENYKWISWNAVACNEEQAFYAIGHDVTDRKQVEKELRSKTAFLEAQTESAIDGLLVVDDRQQKSLSEQAFRRTLANS